MICTLRIKVPVLLTVTAPLQVTPLSVERLTTRGALTHIKVVPGNVHVSEVGRRGVVVGPARLPVVAAAGVNAKMGPASRVQRSGGLVAAQGAAAALPSSQTVNHVPVGLLYRTTGSPKVFAKGL